MGTLYEVQVFLSLVEHVVLLQQCGLSLVQLQQKQHHSVYTVCTGTIGSDRENC